MSVSETDRMPIPKTHPGALVVGLPMRHGCFITFEGIEGSGKTTQLRRLTHRLTEAGIDVVATQEPGGTLLGRELRLLLLRPNEAPMCAEAELLLYVADRAQHLTDLVEPALARGAIVLCDRYVDATLAYQGYGRGLDLDWIRLLHRRPPLDRLPQRTALFDLDPPIGLARAHRRNRLQDLTASEGRFEEERLDFHRRVREGYLDLAAAEPERIRILDASGSEDEVEKRLRQALSDLLPPPQSKPC